MYTCMQVAYIHPITLSCSFPTPLTLFLFPYTFIISFVLSTLGGGKHIS